MITETLGKGLYTIQTVDNPSEVVRKVCGAYFKTLVVVLKEKKKEFLSLYYFEVVIANHSHID